MTVDDAADDDVLLNMMMKLDAGYDGDDDGEDEDGDYEDNDDDDAGDDEDGDE
jgi:hypothetical protein